MNQTLYDFSRLLCGHFDNSVQMARLSQENCVPEGFPLAEHRNTDCTDRIDGLPENFEGIFILEESYYHVGDRTNILPHLFLFTMEGDDVVLDSYEIPEGFTKETFNAANFKGAAYGALSRSERFTPVHYKKDGEVYRCHGVSMFSPVLRFTLTEELGPELLSVSETFEVNGKRTFGWDIPIEYRRHTAKGLLAKEYFMKGYNCTQSVVLAFHEDLGLDPGFAAKIASPFGGGMGRLREVCGAVSGMVMAAGLYWGYSEPKDPTAKKATYERVQKLAHAFAEENGSYICRELLGLDRKEDTPTPSPRTDEYYKKRPCAELVADAADILYRMLREDEKKEADPS